MNWVSFGPPSLGSFTVDRKTVSMAAKKPARNPQNMRQNSPIFAKIGNEKQFFKTCKIGVTTKHPGSVACKNLAQNKNSDQKQVSNIKTQAADISHKQTVNKKLV